MTEAKQPRAGVLRPFLPPEQTMAGFPPGSGKTAPAFLQAREYIEHIPKFIRKNTMQDTRAFYEKLGSPGKGIKVIHVAGTNGKGSVCAFLQSVLMEAGYRAGMFTSPHLIDIRERIRIDRELISQEDFVRVFEAVRDAVWKLDKEREKKPGMAGDARGAGQNREKLNKGDMTRRADNAWNAMPLSYHPSYFEYLYFMAMLYFEEKEPDFILLETGLGGRLDATSSYPSPCISIITEIGLDHMEYLGETEEKIAAEKAGIVKKGIPLVYFAKNKTVADVLEKAVQKADSKAFPVKPPEISLQKCDEKGIDFSYQSGYYGDSTFHLCTKALYQRENAALCIRALAVLEAEGVARIGEGALRLGLEKMFWEGRMEEVLPDVYLDGAHNIDGMRALLECVRRAGGQAGNGIGKETGGQAEAGRILLYATLADKSYEAVIREILRADLFDEIVLTQVSNARTLPGEKLTELFRGKNPAVFEKAEDAFCYCLKRRKKGTKVYVSGSLYLIGQIKDFLKRGKEHDQF